MDLLIREAQVYDAEGIINVLNPIIEAKVYSSLAMPFSIKAERDKL